MFERLTRIDAGGRYNCQCGWDICRDKQPYCMMCGKAIDWEV